MQFTPNPNVYGIIYCHKQERTNLFPSWKNGYASRRTQATNLLLRSQGKERCSVFPSRWIQGDRKPTNRSSNAQESLIDSLKQLKRAVAAR